MSTDSSKCKTHNMSLSLSSSLFLSGVTNITFSKCKRNLVLILNTEEIMNEEVDIKLNTVLIKELHWYINFIRVLKMYHF